MPGSSLWMPYAPQGVKGIDDNDDDDGHYCSYYSYETGNIFRSVKRPKRVAE